MLVYRCKTFVNLLIVNKIFVIILTTGEIYISTKIYFLEGPNNGRNTSLFVYIIGREKQSRFVNRNKGWRDKAVGMRNSL